MLSSERMQIERFELGDASNDAALRSTGRRVVPILNLALIAIAAALLWATIATFDGWAHAIVIAMIVTTTIGLIIAISPRRADA